VEGSLSLLLQCSLYADLEKVLTGEEKEKNKLLLEILTPIAKTYPSEMGVLSVSTGLQCFGGYGYCDDFPLEQYYRDVRIHPIHEGTTGIQAMDLLGRKIAMKNGKAFLLFAAEVDQTIKGARGFDALISYANHLGQEMERLQTVSLHLGKIAQEKGPEVFLADATLYLEMFGIIAIAWQWLQQGIAIQNALAGQLSSAEEKFYNGKWFTCKYFFEYELPKTVGLSRRLLAGDALTVEMQPAFFQD